MVFELCIRPTYCVDKTSFGDTYSSWEFHHVYLKKNVLFIYNLKCFMLFAFALCLSLRLWDLREILHKHTLYWRQCTKEPNKDLNSLVINYTKTLCHWSPSLNIWHIPSQTMDFVVLFTKTGIIESIMNWNLLSSFTCTILKIIRFGGTLFVFTTSKLL